MDKNTLSHTTWECKYHIVFAPKFRRQVIYGAIKADGSTDNSEVYDLGDLDREAVKSIFTTMASILWDSSSVDRGV